MSYRPQVLNVPFGGTGAITLTNHGVLIGRGTGTVVASTAGTVGQIMTSNGPGSDPSFQAPALSGTLDFKDSVRVATAAALPSNTRTLNVLTAAGNGALPQIDGVSLTTSDRLLVKDEVTGANNGIYTVTDLGSAGTPWILTRSTDADTDPEVTNGMYMYVGEGSTNASKSFVLATHDPITLNTTALSFVVFSVAGGAPANADYVTLSLNGILTNERVLTGTASQVIITDNGAGSTVVLSLPQNIATSSSPTFNALTLTNPLTVPNGGTGVATLTAHGVVLGNGTSPVAVTSAGTAGQVLTSNGASADPSFQTPTTGAPVGASYVTLGTDATLTSERVLTGTANQIVVTDGGAGSTVTLSTPQDIATTSIVQFGGAFINGKSRRRLVTSGAGGYTVLGTDSIILKTGITGGGDTVALIAAATFASGGILTIKDASGTASTNNITIDGNGSETIDGSLTFVINTDFGAVDLVTDGANWFVM